VDLIVAATFVSVIDEAARFSNAHHVQSYLGLVPLEATSGGRDKRRLGAITKCGNSYMRSLLVQASWGIMRGCGGDPLRLWASRVADRRGKRIAVVGLARRLAGVLWAMWRHGRAYDPERVGKAATRGLEVEASKLRTEAETMKIATTKAAHRTKKIERRMKNVEISNP